MKTGTASNRTCRLVSVALYALSHSAMALLPDSGWYWNPGESGRGFNIEIQNNVLFVAGFLYDAQGNPMWVFSGGPMANDRTYVGDLFSTAHGQCLGCSYERPPETAALGKVNIAFSNQTHATISFNGVTFIVERQAFAFDFSNPATPLLGEWAITSGNTTPPAVYFGQRISFKSTQVLTPTGLTATGSMTGDNARPAIGYHDPNTGKWAMLLDSSPAYYTIYVFDFSGLNLIQGISSVYLKTASPSGYLDFVGARIRSGAAAAGTNAPGITRAAARAPVPDEAAALEMSGKDSAVIEQLQRIAKQMQ